MIQLPNLGRKSLSSSVGRPSPDLRAIIKRLREPSSEVSHFSAAFYECVVVSFSSS